MKDICYPVNTEPLICWSRASTLQVRPSIWIVAWRMDSSTTQEKAMEYCKRNIVWFIWFVAWISTTQGKAIEYCNWGIALEMD